ncbi:Ig-like domain-containing protein [Undibacterium sp. Dicai25W]|uniref:Ig-like domain-containing protein n=1 Tax=Undibacterium sp. Dicai25W TaxID=3413034 RepID=UPI003BF0E91B
MKSTIIQWRTAALVFGFSTMLIACGGGGADAPGQKPAIGSLSAPTSAPILSISLADSNGVSSNVTTINNPLSVTARIVDGKGVPVPNALLVFSSDQALVNFQPTSGSLITDGNGSVKMQLSPASISAYGAGMLKAVASYSGLSAQAQTAFTVGDSKLSVNFVTPTTNPAMLKAYGSTVITLDVKSNGSLYTASAVSLSLASNCAAAGKATFPATVSTNNGRAQLTYRDNGCGQTDSIVVSVTGATTTASTQIQISPPDAASIQVASILPADQSIVIKGAGGSGRSETASIKFLVIDQFGNPLPNQAVNFSTISTKAVVLNKASDVSDSNGNVTTTVNSGTEPTALRIQASLPNGISSISDTITVTTGLPTQASLSLSPLSYNIEGFNYDNAQTSVTLLLADQFGNPVADNTPVVFQTDSGAIGSAGRGGCTTVNGGCSVTFRSQNPRYSSDASAPQKRAGLATISVSSLNSSNIPLTGQTAIFLSGSYATNITQILDNGTNVPVNGGITLNNNDCSSMILRLRISDARLNPMPSGTTLSASSMVQVQADFFPAIVPTAAPVYNGNYVTGDQGTVHLIPITPSSGACRAGSSKITSGSLMLQITTPNGNVTPLSVSMSFPSAT